MTPEHIEFINSLIGLPWKRAANGPNAFDCWGLSQIVQLKVFNRQLPDIKIATEDVRDVIKEVATTSARKSWKKIDGPVHGAIVEMTSGRYPYHIGVYLDIDGGGILHCHNPSGVCFDRIASLEAAGWRRFIYNDWIG